MIESYIQPFLNEWLDSFTNPQKRLYWIYVFSSIFIGIAYLFYNNRSFINSFKKFFSYDVWLSKSARADYLILFVNSFFMLFISSKLLTKSVIAFALYYWLTDVINQHTMFYGILENWQVAICFTLVLFILDDFTKYWLHRWLHTIPFLWPYHRVHHSATSLNFFTVFRTHPVEAVLFSLRNAFSQGFVVGIFFFLFGDQVTLFMVLGANLFSFTFNLLGSNLRHSPVALPYPKWLEGYLISPAQHHIHHSKAKEHKDKNFGIVFACWDRWFGSIYYSQNEELIYGLQGKNDEKEHKLYELYLSPFFNSFKFLMKSFKRV